MTPEKKPSNVPKTAVVIWLVIVFVTLLLLFIDPH
jgi:hypothetical protein